MCKAFFVRYPRQIEDLHKPHLLSSERPYDVVKEIKLAAIDYDNFITDMCADRQFIEDNVGLCAEGLTIKCLLIRQRGRNNGVLVVPDAPMRPAFMKLAALLALD